MAGMKIVVVDLNSGKHPNKHELFNLEKNKLDGKYYGYVPPHNNVDITKIQFGAKDSVSDVLIVYVQAIGEHDKNREIVAYCENATVYSASRSGENMNRDFLDKDGRHNIAPYCIKSDNLIDLRSLPSDQKFVIEIKKYSSYIFRYQRSYLEEYPHLKEDIITYIQGFSGIDLDDGIEQDKIQNSLPALPEFSSEYGKTADEIVDTPMGKIVKKNPAIAKKVLVDSDYKCFVNMNHITFSTRIEKPYMEGHHLIPCTVYNSELFEKTSKLDREENIVCICPNCHRAIHYSCSETKKRLIEILFDKQKAKLRAAKLDVTLEKLLKFYMV